MSSLLTDSNNISSLGDGHSYRKKATRLYDVLMGHICSVLHLQAGVNEMSVAWPCYG